MNKTLSRVLMGLGISYASLWGTSSLYTEALPKKNNLAIFISEPVKWYDWGRYIPGMTKIYTNRVEQAFGEQAEIYDPATTDDFLRVLSNEHIENIVVAGHGGWNNWEISSTVDIQSGELEPIKKKTGLFIRHTCGVDRRPMMANQIPFGVDFFQPYLQRFKIASHEKIVTFTGYNEKDMKVTIRKGETLTQNEKESVDAIMKEYFHLLGNYPYIGFEVLDQLGTEFVENEENVRGWDTVTNPLLFLWQPIPPHFKDAKERAKEYNTTERQKVLAQARYTIIEEEKQYP